MSDHGNGKEGRLAEISAELDKKTPEELDELARIHGDVDGTYRLSRWLEGALELSDADIEKLLPGVPMLFYERQRKAIAVKLGVRATALDQIRGLENQKPQAGQGTAVSFPEPQPWPDPIDGATLLSDLAGVFTKYVVLPAGAAEALALWTAFTWFHDRFQISPLLTITSPQKRCGKTTLLAVLGQLVPRPLPAANMTAATVYRAIEAFSPTLLADEADTYFKENQELRGVLNAGHLRSQSYVLRCVEPDFEARLFKVWAPKAVALIGRLTGPWSTLADRSIVVQLQRKRQDESVERLRLDRLPGETEELRRKLAGWAAEFNPVVADLEPPELAFLNDRAADNWRPLMAIASLASAPFEEDTWLNRAREAARLLSGREDDGDIRILLLEDLRALFAETGAAWLGSREIVESLCELEGRPWKDFARGKGLSSAKLGDLLRPFGLESRQRKLPDGKVHRGYRISDLEGVFSRYCATLADKSLQDQEIQGSVSVEGSVSSRYQEEEKNKVALQGATRYQGATEQLDLISMPEKEIDDSTGKGSGVAAPEGELEIW